MKLGSLFSSPLLADRRVRWLSLVFLVALVVTGLANYAYYVVRTEQYNAGEFAEQLHSKEKFADNLLNQVVQKVSKKGLFSVTRDQNLFSESENNDVSVYIFKGDSLCFWSSNNVDVRSAGEIEQHPVCYKPLRNFQCMVVQRYDGVYRYAVLVPFRRIPRAGMIASNMTVPGFDLPNDVEIFDHETPGALNILSNNGTYLFSIKYDSRQNHNVVFWGLSVAGAVLAILALLLLNWVAVSLARAGQISRFSALLFAFLSAALIAVLATLHWPECILSNALFTPSGSSLAPTLGQLIVYTCLVFCVYCAVHYLFPVTKKNLKLKASLDKWWKVVLFQLVSVVLFFVAFWLTVYLVYHSAMDVATSYVQDISLVTILSLLLVIPWFAFVFYVTVHLCGHYVQGAGWKSIVLPRLVITAVGLVPIIISGVLALVVAWVIFSVASLAIELYYLKEVNRSFILVGVLALMVINLTVAVCYILCQNRNSERYFDMAELLTDNSNLVHSVDDERIMKEIGRLIVSDQNFHRLMEDTTDARFDNVKNLLLETYFDGFGNKYEFDVQVHSRKSPFTVRKGIYEGMVRCQPDFLSAECIPVAGSNQFFISKRADLPLAYVGVFYHKADVAYVFMYPNLSVYRQDQDAELYSPSNVSTTLNPDISVAKFMNNEMLFVSGSYHYPNNASWIPSVTKQKFHIYKNDCTHYISRFSDNGYIVVTKMEHRSYTYFIFVSYLCALCAIFLLAYSFYWWVVLRRRHAPNSILTRMQIWLLVPMLLAFIILGAWSLYFFMGQYKAKAVTNISEQANSIQLHLQQQLGFVGSIDIDNNKDLREHLPQDVKDMANLFRSDIVVYDVSGRLVASSRSTFLSERRRLHRLMNPVPHFTHQADYFTEASAGSSNYFSFYTYLYNQHNQMVGYVNVRSFSAAEQMRNEVFNLLVVLVDAYLVIVLLTVVVSWLISRRMVKPVTMLADQFKEIKLTGSNAKVEYNDNDELGALVQQYNAMVDKLQVSAEQLAKSQREMAWREMARRIAHEIKNPLTPMKLSVQMAQMRLKRDPDNFPEYFQNTSELLIEQIDNLSRIASEFSTFAKSTVTVREEVNLAAKVQSVVALFENNPEGVHFELDMHGVDTAMVWSDNKQILQVFNNLFKNAIQAIPDDREGLIKVDFKTNDEAVLISITDNGCGIPEENLQTIFQPNFTTKTSGNGLGLPIVKTIVNLANGEIWLDSQVGVGTTFFIRIPLIKPGETADSVQPSATQN